MKFRSILIGVAVTAVVAGGMVAGPANASEAIGPKPDMQRPAVVAPSDTQIQAAFDELDRSSTPRATTMQDGAIVTTFTLPGERTISFEKRATRLGGGWDGKYGLYVEFNRTDQGIIASGAGAGLATALCLLPGVGPALCVVAVAVVGAATAAIAANGMCPHTLRIYAQLLGNPECRR